MTRSCFRSRSIRSLIIGFLSFATLLLIFPKFVAAQITCIQNYQSMTGQQTLGFTSADVQNLVRQISSAIGLTNAGIHAIPCDGVSKVQSIYYDRQEIPKGDYILYDPDWVREVIGAPLGSPAQIKATDQAIVLFGHEIGHLLGRHFTTNLAMPILQKETEADHFAGCAAGALGASWDNVADLLSRIRGDTDTDHPSREHSLAAAKSGYDQCRREPQPVSSASLVCGPMVGGTGGDAFDEQCGQTEIMTGLVGKTGTSGDARLFAIGPICSKIRVDALHDNVISLASSSRDGDANGAYGGEDFRLTCPAGKVVVGTHLDQVGFSDGGQYVTNHVVLDCADTSFLRDMSVPVISVVGPRQSPVSFASKRSFRCPSGTLGTAIKGRSGQWLDAMALCCSLH